jgi:hypothetical protein
VIFDSILKCNGEFKIFVWCFFVLFYLFNGERSTERARARFKWKSNFIQQMFVLLVFYYDHPMCLSISALKSASNPNKLNEICSNVQKLWNSNLNQIIHGEYKKCRIFSWISSCHNERESELMRWDHERMKMHQYFFFFFSFTNFPYQLKIFILKLNKTNKKSLISYGLTKG